LNRTTTRACRAEVIVQIGIVHLQCGRAASPSRLRQVLHGRGDTLAEQLGESREWLDRRNTWAARPQPCAAAEGRRAFGQAGLRTTARRSEHAGGERAGVDRSSAGPRGWPTRNRIAGRGDPSQRKRAAQSVHRVAEGHTADRSRPTPSRRADESGRGARLDRPRRRRRKKKRRARPPSSPATVHVTTYE